MACHLAVRVLTTGNLCGVFGIHRNRILQHMVNVTWTLSYFYTIKSHCDVFRFCFFGLFDSSHSFEIIGLFGCSSSRTFDPAAITKAASAGL